MGSKCTQGFLGLLEYLSIRLVEARHRYRGVCLLKARYLPLASRAIRSLIGPCGRLSATYSSMISEKGHTLLEGWLNNVLYELIVFVGYRDPSRMQEHLSFYLCTFRQRSHNSVQQWCRCILDGVSAHVYLGSRLPLH